MYLDLPWETVERGHNPRKKERFISIRATSILINTGFFKDIGGKEKGYRHVLVRRNNDHFLLLFEFLTEKEYQTMLKNNPFTDGVHALVQDGGSKGKNRTGNSFAIGCGRLIDNTPWLKAISKQRASKLKRFTPEEAGKSGAYVIKFMPSFENESDAHFCGIDVNTKGIYCYLAANGETLYIGQGAIKNRFKAHKAQKDIPAKTFKWTVIADEQQRLMAESHHLKAFVAQNGRLPTYNRVAGHSFVEHYDPNT